MNVDNETAMLRIFYDYSNRKKKAFRIHMDELREKLKDFKIDTKKDLEMALMELMDDGMQKYQA